MAPPINRKLRLTDNAVKKLPEGRSWDKDINGFGVKVYPTGKRQFILRYRTPEKKQREFRIGQFGIISADEARQKAKILIGKINEGADPQWERKVGLAEAKDFNSIIDKYLEYALEHHKPTSLREVQNYCRLHIRKHFGDLPCQKISKGYVQRIFDGLKQAPHYRSKIIQWSRIIWSWAEQRELVGEQRNPFTIETRVPKPKRSRILSPDEYSRLWQAIEKYRYKGVIPKISLYAIEMLILTPLRKNECFQLEWTNVDFDTKTILVTAHKTDRYSQAIELTITAPLLDLLTRMPKSNKWLFPAPDSKSGHLEYIDNSWTRIRKEADLYELKSRITLHDLRRSWNSVGASLGYDPAVMGKIIGNSARVNSEHYWHIQDNIKETVSSNIAEKISNFRKSCD